MCLGESEEYHNKKSDKPRTNLWLSWEQESQTIEEFYCKQEKSEDKPMK
jgi:hypothetical protein